MQEEMINNIYRQWRQHADGDADLMRELKAMEKDKESLTDSFYRNLSFGTGGLRGVIGAGTNRMNIYTVARASQGLSDYVKRHFAMDQRRIAVSYDSRIKSELFAQVAAGVFAGNGIEVHIYDELMPTPCLSFAVRTLHCAAGIMITASHNPAKYNGYKVYGADGCQITTEAAAEIQAEIEKVDIFNDVEQIGFQEGIHCGKIHFISAGIEDAFVEEVKKQTLLCDSEAVDKNVAIVYTPLNGTGLKPVIRTLKESGYSNISVVREQEQPDGNFPTCPYPNPEIREAMVLGIEYAQRNHAELLLATDPDCDRVGIAVRDKTGKFVLLSGNETGMLLLDYICSRRKEQGRMPENPVMIKTIVTADMAERIAARYGVRTINVLTGFKFIGEQIGQLEKKGAEQTYIFGFEESYGYLSGTYVRDKDAVNGSFLICEMFAYYKSRGISLPEKLEELYTAYGYCLNTLHSYEFDGIEGFKKMQDIMKELRSGIIGFGSKKVLSVLDYLKGIDGLPVSDVLKFLLSDNCSVVVRPSGTEPKLKVYVSVSAESRQAAEMEEQKIVKSVEEYLLCR